MKFRETRCADRNAGLGALLLAGLILPGGSVLIAWAIYRWVAHRRGSAVRAPSRTVRSITPTRP